jgi:hypothetical protein
MPCPYDSAQSGRERAGQPVDFVVYTETRFVCFGRTRIRWIEMDLKVVVLSGLLGALLITGGVLLFNRDTAPRLDGQITQVRTLGMDQNSSVAIVNFEAVNGSNNRLIIARRDLLVVGKDGAERAGSTISVSDLQYLFELYPALGGMGFEPLVDRVRLEPEQPLRGILAARFDMAKHDLDQRQAIIFRVEDVDGKRSELRSESEPRAEKAE